MMRSQPHYYRGRLDKLGIKFFTLAVYVTMYLRDAQSGIYAKLGIDWERYDLKVINETELAARGVWSLAIRTERDEFAACLRTMAENNRRNERGRSAKGLAKAGCDAVPAPGRSDRPVRQTDGAAARLGRSASRSEWTQVCNDPGDVSGLALAGATPAVLRVPPAPLPQPA
jgi:hypothetical protein